MFVSRCLAVVAVASLVLPTAAEARVVLDELLEPSPDFAGRQGSGLDNPSRHFGQDFVAQTSEPTSDLGIGEIGIFLFSNNSTNTTSDIRVNVWQTAFDTALNAWAPTGSPIGGGTLPEAEVQRSFQPFNPFGADVTEDSLTYVTMDSPIPFTNGERYFFSIEALQAGSVSNAITLYYFLNGRPDSRLLRSSDGGSTWGVLSANSDTPFQVVATVIPEPLTAAAGIVGLTLLGCSRRRLL